VPQEDANFAFGNEKKKKKTVLYTVQIALEDTHTHLFVHSLKVHSIIDLRIDDNQKQTQKE
jgi:hypothetical protein